MDESILIFFRVSLSKFSLEASTFRGYKGIYSRVCEEYEKSFFCKTGGSGDSFTIGTSCKITDWLDCPFCPIVLQLS